MGEEQIRNNERERILKVLIKEIPKHRLDLEDAMWLKRVLKKAFREQLTIKVIKYED